MDFDDLDAAEEAAAPAMRFFAISDVHGEHKQNMRWVYDLPHQDKSTLIVAGDLAVSVDDIRQALEIFVIKFTHVFYCFGNHDAWVSKADESSFEKLRLIRRICQNLGVKTRTELIGGVWVVPVLGWYHTSWDTEPALMPPPGQKLAREPKPAEEIGSDYMFCKWDGMKNGSEELAERLDKENEVWGSWPLPEELLRDAQQPRGQRERPILSFSHFLPELPLMPEKRFLFQPNLPKLVGSNWVKARVDQLRPDVHIFGHTHFPWDMWLEDVHYRSWPLMPPKERAGLVTCFPTEKAEKWFPLLVFDSHGNHPPKEEVCYYSNMYELIGRDPTSGVMFKGTAQLFCPDAPTVPRHIQCPGRRDTGPLDSEEEMDRRARFMALLGPNFKDM